MVATGRSGNANRAIPLDGAKCVVARTRKGWSRERLAEESHGGLSVATIKRLEKGAAVYIDTARRFADLVGASVQELIAEDESDAVPDLLRRPSVVAVMPFDTFDENQESRFFADGLVEDLISRLGRLWFPVIARASSFLYRGVRVDPSTLRADLGADYAIEGSVRRANGTVRVTARLIDTKNAHQVWANVFDRPYTDVFAMQDSIVASLIAQVDEQLLSREVQASESRDFPDLSAWELALRGSWHFHHRTRDGNVEAKRYFEEALRKDARLPLAWYSLALTHQRAIVNQWSTDPGSAQREMGEVCTAFARHHPNDPGLHVALAYGAIYAGDRPVATRRLRDAIVLDPNHTTAYSLYGQLLAMDGDADGAIEQFEQSIRLSPRDSELWSVQTAVALCNFVAERYEDMLAWADNAIRSRHDMPFPHGAKAVALASLERLDEARAAVSTMLSLEPRTTAGGLQAIVASTRPEITARYLSALRRAGLPG